MLYDAGDYGEDDDDDDDDYLINIKTIIVVFIIINSLLTQVRTLSRHRFKDKTVLNILLFSTEVHHPLHVHLLAQGQIDDTYQ